MLRKSVAISNESLITVLIAQNILHSIL